MGCKDAETARIDTLAERKVREAARRRQAADKAVERLRTYANAHGGRFIVFGSYVADRMRYDSDLDVLIDLDPAGSTAAWRFLEALAEELNLPIDIKEAAFLKPAFVARVEREGKVIA